MAACVNVVGTRCLDGDHAALQRWYGDHVHQLMACEGLLAARLWCRESLSATSDPAPQWLCCYDFSSPEAFAAYEASDVKAAAEADRLNSWGRDGIHITFRQAFARVYRRRSAVQPDAAAAKPVVCLAGNADLRALAAAAEPDFEALSSTQPGAAQALIWGRLGFAPSQPLWQANYQAVMQWHR